MRVLHLKVPIHGNSQGAYEIILDTNRDKMYNYNVEESSCLKTIGSFADIGIKYQLCTLRDIFTSFVVLGPGPSLFPNATETQRSRIAFDIGMELAKAIKRLDDNKNLTGR